LTHLSDCQCQILDGLITR